MYLKIDDYKGEKTYMYILTKDIDETNVGDTVIVDRAGKKLEELLLTNVFIDKIMHHTL